MVTVTRGVGAALVAIGVIAYVASGAASWTALLPAIPGVVIVGLGLLAGKASLHRHAIHGALAVALLTILGTVPRALPALTGDGDLAAWASLATALVSAVYVGLGVRSFIAARRARETVGP